jgi:hypothetical protein
MDRTDRDPVTTFRTRTFPVPVRPAGYAYLIDRFQLNTILPHRIHAVATVNTSQRHLDCAVHPVARQPRDTVHDHLVFALKNEGVDLLVLRQVFAAAGPGALQGAIRDKPTSAYLRRLCFLYEWLTGERLDPPEAVGGAYADALDGRLQYCAPLPVNVQRWRVRDNLPGTRAFCPLVARTRRLDAFLRAGLKERAAALLDGVPPEILMRAAAFLLLNDSKASFEIERERPPKDRMQRWAAVIGRAGERPVTVETLVEMQRDLIGDERFVHLGLRKEDGFVGERDLFGAPRPDHVSAKAEDLRDLLGGLVAFDKVSAERGYDPVLSAASLAFGFAYVHPFEDGNGRLHRWLIHHVLAARGFMPTGVAMPVSTAILDKLVDYRHALEALSRPMLTVIDWQPTERGNVDVLNETADLYRYFDATRHAEFLFECLERAIEHTMRDELRLLSSRDAFHRGAARIVDMPEGTLDVLFHMLRQNGGRFSKRMREREFGLLRDDEAGAFETLFERSAGAGG